MVSLQTAVIVYLAVVIVVYSLFGVTFPSHPWALRILATLIVGAAFVYFMKNQVKPRTKDDLAFMQLFALIAFVLPALAIAWCAYIVVKDGTMYCSL